MVFLPMWIITIYIYIFFSRTQTHLHLHPKNIAVKEKERKSHRHIYITYISIQSNKQKLFICLQLYFTLLYRNWSLFAKCKTNNLAFTQSNQAQACKHEPWNVYNIIRYLQFNRFMKKEIWMVRNFHYECTFTIPFTAFFVATTSSSASSSFNSRK